MGREHLIGRYTRPVGVHGLALGVAQQGVDQQQAVGALTAQPCRLPGMFRGAVRSLVVAEGRQGCGELGDCGQRVIRRMSDARRHCPLPSSWSCDTRTWSRR